MQTVFFSGATESVQPPPRIADDVRVAYERAADLLIRTRSLLVRLRGNKPEAVAKEPGASAASNTTLKANTDNLRTIMVELNDLFEEIEQLV